MRVCVSTLRSKRVFWWFSLVLVGMGTPFGISLLAPLVAAGGFALFWISVPEVGLPRDRFWSGTVWFCGVQLMQLFWLTSHPYSYIYFVWFILSFLMGIQWGFLTLFMTKQRLQNFSWIDVGAFSGLWIFLEWARLWVFSGFPFNPVGMTLAFWEYPLQLASIAGVYGLSFWVMITNYLAVQCWLCKSKKKVFFWLLLAAFPYLFGWGHIWYQDLAAPQGTLTALLLQPNFPSEETMGFASFEEAREHVLQEWEEIAKSVYTALTSHPPVQIIGLPEYVVPYSAAFPAYSLSQVTERLLSIFGKDVEQAWPPLEPPYAMWQEGYGEWFVSNSFISQTIANWANASLVVGLEERESRMDQKKMYSSAFQFFPHTTRQERYAKRVLVPMGEYIPFDWCRSWSAQYGVVHSFTPGQSAAVFEAQHAFSPCICYEELYGHLMRECKKKGACWLLNLTNDGWYPSLVWTHFYHARLRAVENGMPLLRSCNTGITCGVDALSRVVGLLPPAMPSDPASFLRVEVPLKNYTPLYFFWGDWGIMIFSLLLGVVRFFWFNGGPFRH